MEVEQLRNTKKRLTMDICAVHIYVWRIYSKDSTMGMDRDRRIEKLLPLRPVEFHILLSLAGGERHGYGIMQDARERGEAVPDVGTLYRALARMVDQGLIAPSGARRDPEPDVERRNYYRITPE